LIKVPSAWPPALVATVAMALLAALDLGGAVAAKEAVARRSWLMAAAGAALFVVLFWVYCSSLQYVGLAPVTLGWVVILQIGVVLVDCCRYGASMPTTRWVAVAVIITAQAYLMLGPGSDTGPS
jgi:hypothetical protein